MLHTDVQTHPQLPPPRDRMPTMEFDLSEYAQLHTGPASWSARNDEVGHYDVPRVVADAAEVDDHREAFVLSLVDGTSNVGELLAIAGLPAVDVLAAVAALHARGVITLER
jgi:hypothetical protein